MRNHNTRKNQQVPPDIIDIPALDRQALFEQRREQSLDGILERAAAQHAEILPLFTILQEQCLNALVTRYERTEHRERLALDLFLARTILRIRTFRRQHNVLAWRALQSYADLFRTTTPPSVAAVQRSYLIAFQALRADNRFDRSVRSEFASIHANLVQWLNAQSEATI